MTHVKNGSAASLNTSIESRVETSLCIANYIRCGTEFERASNAFQNACSQMRGLLSGKQRFVAVLNRNSYLVTSDDDGNFNVEPIESI